MNFFSYRIVFRSALILGIVFAVLISAICFAQDSGAKNVQKQKKRYGSSSIGALNSGGIKTGYNKSLSDSTKMEIIEGLSEDELLELFNALKDGDLNLSISCCTH